MTAHKRHATMKDSGVAWLGRIPAHWEVVQSRRMFGERKEKARAGDVLLTASQKYGMIPQLEFMELEGRRVVEINKGADSLIHVEEGDFVISLRSFQGGLEFSRTAGSITFHYVPIHAVKWVHVPFFVHLFKSSAYIQALRATANLIRDGQDMRFTHFAQVPLPKVPLDEQAAIADHLDRETARIDNLIARKTRFIELLKESIVAAATHVQVDKDTRWVHLKHICEQVVRPVAQLPGDTYTKLGLYNRGRGIFKKNATDTEDMGDSDFHWVNNGDLVISGQFAWEGSVAMAREEHSNCVVSHRYPILNGREGEVLSDYLYAYFLTSHGNMILNDCSRGSAGRNKPLNMNLLMNWKIPVPTMEAQKRIASLVVHKEKFEALQKKSITLLQEHRTALITDAVTGKIDLRDNA